MTLVSLAIVVDVEHEKAIIGQYILSHVCISTNPKKNHNRWRQHCNVLKSNKLVGGGIGLEPTNLGEA